MFNGRGGGVGGEGDFPPFSKQPGGHVIIIFSPFLPPALGSFCRPAARTSRGPACISSRTSGQRSSAKVKPAAPWRRSLTRLAAASRTGSAANRASPWIGAETSSAPEFRVGDPEGRSSTLWLRSDGAGTLLPGQRSRNAPLAALGLPRPPLPPSCRGVGSRQRFASRILRASGGPAWEASSRVRLLPQLCLHPAKVRLRRGAELVSGLPWGVPAPSPASTAFPRQRAM